MKLPTEFINGIKVQPFIIEDRDTCQRCCFVGLRKCPARRCKPMTREDNNDVYFVKVGE
jgi:hypothetical protein